MTRDEVMTKLRAHEAELRAAGVEALWLFGSFARDEAGEGSDVDLLFDRPRDLLFTLFDLIGLQERMAAIMGRPVDLGTRRGIKPWARERIQRDSLQIF